MARAAARRAGPARKTAPDARYPAAPPATLVLFGAGGDLVKRLLMPALCNLRRDGLIDDRLRILAVDRETRSDAQYAEALRSFMKQQDAGLDPGLWKKIAARISYQQGDLLDPQTYHNIAAHIGRSGSGNAVFYLAIPPDFFGDVIEQIGAAGLLKETASVFRRVIIEKPFGRDLASARALNARILAVIDETQAYRMDHFLGKETVQSVLVSRFANSIFEGIWNSHYIDHVQITAAETVGVEQRGSFYEHTGALRDMVPNHLMQLLAMVAMEPPSAFGADAVRDEKAKVLGSIRPTSPREALDNAVRGQYRAGRINGKPVPGYRSEDRVAPGSRTETYVALKLMVDSWRWVGVPFYLRTGKRLGVRDTRITMCFKPAPTAQFRGTRIGDMRSNALVLKIQPNEGLWLDFHVKRPGPVVEVAEVGMNFCYADAFEMLPSTGYETLIYDCLIGDQTLFQRADSIESGWRAVQPFLDAWAEPGGRVEGYAAGSDGPKAAERLLQRDGRSWHTLG